MRTMSKLWTVALFIALTCILVGAVGEVLANGRTGNRADKKEVSRGRYLVKVAGCNDCHTPSFMEGKTDVPESEWLTGSGLGFNGPWGTSYPWNLRLLVQRMTESEWLSFTKTYNAAPPMPTMSLKAMSDEDLKAVYAFIKSLGAAGTEAPTNLPPGVTPTTPYVDFMPKLPSAH